LQGEVKEANAAHAETKKAAAAKEAGYNKEINYLVDAFAAASKAGADAKQAAAKKDKEYTG